MATTATAALFSRRATRKVRQNHLLLTNCNAMIYSVSTTQGKAPAAAKAKIDELQQSQTSKAQKWSCTVILAVYSE